MDRFAAVLFDMDGVVIDTRQSVMDFWNAFAAERGIRLQPEDFDSHIFGVTAAHTLKTLFPPLTPSELSALYERISQYERGLRYTEVPGVRALLRSLKAAAVPTALVTSGEQWKVDEVESQLELTGLFDVTITAGDIQRGKPDPQCYLLAAEALKLVPERCIVFEDSISGMQSARKAGATCVGVQIGRLAESLLAQGAWAVVPDFRCVSAGSLSDMASDAKILPLCDQWSLRLA